MVRRSLLFTLLFALGLTAPASAQWDFSPSQWHGLPGLDAANGASWVRSIAFGNPITTVYAGLEGGGVYRSESGGINWQPFNAGIPNPAATNVRALLVDGTTVYAGMDSGVWKSTGGAWQPLAQGAETDPGNPTKLNGSVQSLVSLSGGPMLAGVFSGGVYRSNDGGETWIPPAPGNGMPASTTPWSLTSNVVGIVYASTNNGIFASTDAGASWTATSDGIPSGATPLATWVWPQRDNVVFASTLSNGIYRSLNGGITWAPINDNLGAVRARGFHIFAGDNAVHLYAATENGVWGAITGYNLFEDLYTEPRWRQVTTDGIGSNLINWALTPPVIPSQGSPGLVVGTQSNGGYFLAFGPPSNTCPFDHHTDTGSATAPCPDVQGTVQVGRTITAGPGDWDGTETIEYEYQWYRCTSSSGSSCSEIPNEDQDEYIVRAGDLDFDSGTAGNQAYRFRVGVTGDNDAPTFGLVDHYSGLSGAVAPKNGTLPGDTNTAIPGISPAGAIEVGDQLTATTGMASGDGWFNPSASSRAWQWYRCEDGGGDDTCEEIPGADNQSYILTTADGTKEMIVRVIGTNSSGSRALQSARTIPVTSEPAQIAPSLIGEDGQPISQAPSVVGPAWVGETLVGNVGGWKDPTTGFWRRWLRCDADGGACTNIQKVASTDNENGVSYTVREADLGYTIRMRVFADVNGDADNEQNNFNPPLTEIDTAPTAVVTRRPVTPPGGGGPGGGDGPPGGGGLPGADTTAPVLSALSMTRRRFRVARGRTARVAAAKRGTAFRFTVSELSTARIAITRPAKGRRVGGRCRPATRRNRRRPRCTRQEAMFTLVRNNVPPGAVRVNFTGRVGRKALRRGAHRARIVAVDGANNASRPATTTFRVVRR